MKTVPRSKTLRRTSERGAALVEGAVVMPVIIMFYGLLIYAFNCYDMKETQMAHTRHLAFSNSLHQCTNVQLEQQPTATRMANVPSYTVNSDVAEKMLTGARLNTFISEREMKTIVTTSGTATNAPLSKTGLSRHIETKSQVHCVPRDVDLLFNPPDNLVDAARREGLGIVRRSGDSDRSLVDILR